MAMIELVDFNEVYKSDEKEKKKTRRRGGKAKTTASETVIEVVKKRQLQSSAEEADTFLKLTLKMKKDTERCKIIHFIFLFFLNI